MYYTDEEDDDRQSVVVNSKSGKKPLTLPPPPPPPLMEPNFGSSSSFASPRQSFKGEVVECQLWPKERGGNRWLS